MSAPVCHIPGTTTSGLTPTAVQTVPVATPTLESLTKTVNALRQLVLQMSGQQSQNFLGLRSTNDPKKVQWSEKSRKIEKVKVYQNDDKSSPNWVEVEQINQLVMVDKNTGQEWTWDRKRR